MLGKQDWRLVDFIRQNTTLDAISLRRLWHISLALYGEANVILNLFSELEADGG